MSDLNADHEEIVEGDFLEQILQILETDDIEVHNKTPTRENVEVRTGLEEYLINSSKGKEILYKYSKSNNILPRNTRSKLVRLVIEREKDWKTRNVPAHEQLKKFSISSERFKILANEICFIFQNECTDTYFTPFMK